MRRKGYIFTVYPILFAIYIVLKVVSATGSRNRTNLTLPFSSYGNRFSVGVTFPVYLLPITSYTVSKIDWKRFCRLDGIADGN
jgi:hypothetical protein